MESKNEKHKTTKVLIAILIGLVILGIGVFAGLSAGHFRKAQGNRFMLGNVGDFGWREGMGMPGRIKEGKQFSLGHQSGEITNISGNNLTIKNSDNKEISVATLDETSIYTNDDSIASISDLKTGVKVNIIGRPNSAGVVQANIIKIQ